MLKYLRIKNIALIKELTVNFAGGLNVLTGETGAGKSIIIDSLNFVLGGKVNKTLIRSGESFMQAEAMFAGPFSEQVLSLLAEYGIIEERSTGGGGADEPDEILIIRSYTETSANIKLNGCTLTAAMLKNITPYLVDIHGQHEHQSLLKSKFHLSVIDNLAGGINSPPLRGREGTRKVAGCFSLGGQAEQSKGGPLAEFPSQREGCPKGGVFDLKNETAELFKQYNNVLKEIDALGSSAQNRERMLDLLKYQIDEIERFNLQEGEDEELAAQKERMQNSEKIAANLLAAYEDLESTNGAVVRLKSALSALNNIIKYDEDLSTLKDRLESTKIEIADISAELKGKTEENNFDEYTFEKIDGRLDQIKLLKKKYGGTIPQIFAFLTQSKQEYERLINSTELLETLQKQKENLYKNLYNKCKELSGMRKQTAADFEQKVGRELSELGMKNAKFEVQFSEGDVTANGFDNAEFMFSANLGQPLKPLAEIISGGEMSRFMLGVKNILADTDKIETLVFDEIDTGISGNIGFVIACKMANISKIHQVISVSHLPQIAAMSDAHFLINKIVENNNTITTVERLTPQGSIKEIARLSGGAENSAATTEHAKELKARCEAYKNKK